MPADALADSSTLAKRAATKVIEDNHMPNREDVEEALFGEEAVSRPATEGTPPL